MNPSILNDEWVGFLGDSEYQSSDGLKMSYWSFVGITDKVPSDAVILTVDDCIDDSELFVDQFFAVENKKQHICVVKFHYGDD